MTNEITVEGVTYNVSDETTYTMEPKKLYKDEYGHYVKLSAENVTYYLCSSDERWRAGHVVFPLRELLVVEKQPDEWRGADTWHRYYQYGTKDWVNGLQKSITETLKASRIRIHNVDGSVSEYSAWGGDAWQQGIHLVVHNVVMQDRLQNAFMRGSKVEVLG